MTVIKEGKSYRKVGMDWDRKSKNLSYTMNLIFRLGVNNPMNHTFIDKYYYNNSLKMIVERRPLTKTLG